MTTRHAPDLEPRRLIKVCQEVTRALDLVRDVCTVLCKICGGLVVAMTKIPAHLIRRRVNAPSDNPNKNASSDQVSNLSRHSQCPEACVWTMSVALVTLCNIRSVASTINLHVQRATVLMSVYPNFHLDGFSPSRM